MVMKMEGMRAARLRSLTALLLLASCLSPGAADTGGCECALTVEAVGDTITSESMWRKKLQQLLPDITMVGPNFSKGTAHAGYNSYTTEALMFGCPGEYSFPCQPSDKPVGGFAEWLLPYAQMVDVYLVMVGTNNVWNQETMQSVEQLDELVRAILEENEDAHVLLSSILPIWNEQFHRVLEYNEEIELMVEAYQAEGLQVRFVDNFEGFDLSEDAKSDLVNPNDGSGSTKIAEKFAAAISEVCCEFEEIPEIGTCKNVCGKKGVGQLECWCDHLCGSAGDCCIDYNIFCSDSSASSDDPKAQSPPLLVAMPPPQVAADAPPPLSQGLVVPPPGAFEWFEGFYPPGFGGAEQPPQSGKQPSMPPTDYPPPDVEPDDKEQDDRPVPIPIPVPMPRPMPAPASDDVSSINADGDEDEEPMHGQPSPTPTPRAAPSPAPAPMPGPRPLPAPTPSPTASDDSGGLPTKVCPEKAPKSGR
mmetsp:Transcript_5802/g.21139  ORF Transcript_5802/g.21139 Transcript_5802/m.21139 type:complete len:475 (-) Transcript_5802:325-1749(-)